MDRIRVAYAGHDFFVSCLLELMNNPRTDVVLCLTEKPGHTPAAENVNRLANECGATIITGRPDDRAVRVFNEHDIDLLVCAAYMHKIPVDGLSTRWAVNVHPTLLPEGRGGNPLPYLAAERPDLAGISLHHMTMELDRGPILLQRSVTLDRGEGVDELYLKLFAEAPQALRALLDDIDKYYAGMRTSGAGSYWPELDDSARSLKAAETTVAEARAFHAKFGMFGIFVELRDGTRLAARHLLAATCEHDYTPGTLVAELTAGVIVATQDGLLSLGPAQRDHNACRQGNQYRKFDRTMTSSENDERTDPAAPPSAHRSELSGSAHDVVQARNIQGGVHFHGARHALGPVPRQLPADGAATTKALSSWRMTLSRRHVNSPIGCSPRSI